MISDGHLGCLCHPVDRAAWLGDLRLEGVIAGAMSANGDLVGLIRLILSDVEAEEFAPAPHVSVGLFADCAVPRQVRRLGPRAESPR
jgi:hypothetical protein